MKTKSSSTFFVITLSILLFKISAFAGTDVWTGGGGNANLFWLSTANWNPAQIPQTGDTLIFTNAVGLINSNNIPNGNFSGITFATPAGAFVLNGNSVTLANITDLQVVTPETINLPITDNGSANLNVNVAANGVLNLNNIISGTGNLTNSGAGRVNLTGSNTFTGSLVINGGLVTVSQETNLPVAPITPTPGNIIINGGALQALAGFTINSNRGIAVGPTSGSGQGTISVNTEASTPNQYATLNYGGAIINNGGGTGGLTKLGFGNLVLSGTNTYTGTTSNEVGTLTLDFSKPGAPANNIISSSSPLVFGGSISGAGVTNFAQLVMTNSAAGTVSQTFNGTHVTVGSAIIRVASGSGTANLTLGALDHDFGGVLAIMSPTLSGGSGSVSTTSTNLNGIIGGWATSGGGNTVVAGWPVNTNWACIDVNSNIVNYNNFTVYSSGYVSSIMAATNNILIPSTATGTLTNAPDNTTGIWATYDVNTITIDRSDTPWTFQIGVSNILRLGKSGGILKRYYAASTVINFGTGGTGAGELTAGGPNIDTPGDIVLTSYQPDSANNNLALISPIVDNGAGAVTVVKAGSGYASLNGVNSYSGGTYIEGGRLRWNGGSYGSGPIYIFPGGYTYVNGGTVITNAWFLSGNGSQQEAGLGALRYGPGPNSGSFFTGPITLIGDTEIGGQGSGAIVGPISGPFKLIVGCLASASGDTTLVNTNNSWSGDTLLTARNNAGVNSLTLSNSEVIPNGFGKGNVSMQGFSTGQFQWNLNGFNETINGLSLASGSVGTSCIISNGAASTTSTLTLGDNDQSGTFGGILKAGNGTLALTKIGAGVETLTAANTYSGATTISNGVLQLTGSGTIANSANVNINGGTFDVSSYASYGVPSTQTINVTGGTLFINTANSSTTPVNFTNGTLKVTALNGSANLTVPTLNIGGSANVIQVINAPLINTYPSAFPVIKYTTLNGIPAVSGIAPTFLASLPTTGFPPFGGFISNDTATTTLYLVFTNGPVTPLLTWVGFSGGSLNSTWDFVVSDWTNKPAHQQASYTDGSLVVFDDGGQTNVVNLNAQDVYPAGITFSNNNVNYTLTGNFGIRTNSLTKQGTGKVILDNAQTSTNDYAGGTLISGGIVQVGINDTGGGLGSGTVGNNGVLVFNRINNNLIVSNAISGSGSLLVSNAAGTTLTLAGANSFGGGSSVIVSNVLQAGNASALGTGTNLIANSAALDINGFSLSGAAVNVSGAGLTTGGVTNGAIYNSAASSSGPPSVTKVTLLGDTVFGCPPNAGASTSNRWDIRGTGAALSTGGNAYNLIKIGINQVSIVDAAVDPMLNNIDVQGGELGFQESSTGLGNTGANLYIRNNAALEMYNATNQLNKQIQMGTTSSDTTSLLSDSGNNTIIGPMTLNGTVNVTVTNGTMTLSNSTGGSGSLNQNGSGTLMIAGSSSYNGGTMVNGGTFIINGINNSTGTQDANQLTAAAGTTVGGSGTYTVPVDIEGVLWPGVSGKPSTLSVGNNVDYEDNSSDTWGALSFGGFGGVTTNIFSLNSTPTAGGGINDLINVTGDLYANGAAIFINPLGSLQTGNTYTLVNYSGSKISSYSGTVLVAPAVQPSRYQFNLNQGSGNNSAVTLTVSTGAGTMEWNNAAGNSVWDIDNSANWSNEVSHVTSDVFYQSDAVVLDNGIIASGATNVITITTNNPHGSGPSPVLPSSITVNSTTNYVINGPGSIGGTANLVKQGTSTLTINSANTFSGTISVYGGTLQLNAANTPASTLITNGTVLINNTNALGGVSAPVYVTNSGTLDIGGASFGANQAPLMGSKPIYISGWGVNSNGCLINSSTSQLQENAFQNITMTGDAAISGSGSRFDIGRITPATFSTGGNPYSLYKVGSNQVSFVSVTVDTNLGNIDIKGGELGFEQGTTSMGNPLSNAIVEVGATLEFYAGSGTNNFTKQFIINGDNITTNVYCSNGNLTLNGNMTLNNICGIGVGGTALTNNTVMSGSGGVIKTGGGLLVLTTNETYTGNTTVNAGTLSLIGNASIATSTNITLGGGTIDVSGRVNNTLTLVSGQTLAGSGTINGSLSNLDNAIIAPGTATTTGVINVTTNIWTSGFTTIVKINTNGNMLPNNIWTNDVLAASGNINYAGVLDVTNISATALVAGNSFQFFNAATYSGSFSTLNLPTLSAGLTWVNSLITNGTLIVVSTAPPTPPHITGIVLSGTTLTITATNGSDGGSWTLLQSTNVSLPLSQWQTNIQGTFDGSGDLSTNIANTVSNTQEFYILKQ